MSEEEAAARAVYVLVKQELWNPDSAKEYMLVFQDKKAAYRTCAQLNVTRTRYRYSVLSTIFSGPFTK